MFSKLMRETVRKIWLMDNAKIKPVYVEMVFYKRINNKNGILFQRIILENFKLLLILLLLKILKLSKSHPRSICQTRRFTLLILIRN